MQWNARPCCAATDASADLDVMALLFPRASVFCDMLLSSLLFSSFDLMYFVLDLARFICHSFLHTQNLSLLFIYLWLCALAVWLVVGLGLLGLGICFWGSLSPVHSLWFLWISPQSRRGNEKLRSDFSSVFSLLPPDTKMLVSLYIWFACGGGESTKLLYKNWFIQKVIKRQVDSLVEMEHKTNTKLRWKAQYKTWNNYTQEEILSDDQIQINNLYLNTISMC